MSTKLSNIRKHRRNGRGFNRGVVNMVRHNNIGGGGQNVGSSRHSLLANPTNDIVLIPSRQYMSQDTLGIIQEIPN